MEKSRVIGLLRPTMDDEVAPAMRPFAFQSNEMIEAEVLRAQTLQPALAQPHKLIGGEFGRAACLENAIIRGERIGQARTHHCPVPLVKGAAQA